MAAFTMSKHIEAEPGVVFEACTDFAAMAERIPGIEKIEMLTDGPVSLGTRFRETRIMFKKEATEEMEVTAFEAGKSFVLEANSCGCQFVTTHTFTPEGSGTRLELIVESRPQTLMAKMMSPLSYLMQGMMKKCIEADLEQLKKAVESRANQV